MSTLRDDLLDVADDIRGIPGDLGLRLFSVSVVVVTWTGARPNAPGSTKTVTVTPIKTGLGAFDVKVRNVSQRDAIASGGLYTDQDLEIGPITPPFVGLDEGNSLSELDPPMAATAREILYRIAGPGMNDPAGDYFEKIGQRADRPFRYVLTVRKTAQRPNL